MGTDLEAVVTWPLTVPPPDALPLPLLVHAVRASASSASRLSAASSSSFSSAIRVTSSVTCSSPSHHQPHMQGTPSTAKD